MSSLTARNVSLSFGPEPILRDVSVRVSSGRRIGVVGPNGVGKSTLLRVLAGIEAPDSGQVTAAPPTATVGLLPQEPDRRGTETVAQFVARRTGVAEASAELDRATETLVGDHGEAHERYSAALERWMALGGADLDARMGAILAELNLNSGVQSQTTESLSGGQAARVSLAATIVSSFDIVLLDEPTNDLDFEGLARLEHFLSRHRAVVVVSHDRAFLERVVTHVLDLDTHAHTAQFYSGGWQAYLADRVTARRHAQQDYDAYTAKSEGLARRAQTQREWSARGVKKAKDSGENDKFIRFNNVASSEKVAHKSKATERAIERLNVVAKPWEPWELRFEIGSTARSGDVVAKLDQAEYQASSFRLGPVDLQIDWADRVVVEGPNGAGKTSLLDVLMGRRSLAAGSSFVGPGVVVGELSQRRARFDGDATLLEVMNSATDLPTAEVRSLLAKFGLGADHVSRASLSLSPGERTRANLALFMAEGVNCLVLDEPTNHLDLVAIEQLEQALDQFVGTLLLVSHDQAFLDHVRITRRVAVAEGQVREVPR